MSKTFLNERWLVKSLPGPQSDSRSHFPEGVPGALGTEFLAWTFLSLPQAWCKQGNGKPVTFHTEAIPKIGRNTNII